MERLNELTMGEKLASAGGVLMLIASFLPWYKVDFGIGSVSRNGWQSPGSLWSLLAVVISVAIAATILGSKFGNMRLPDLGSITWPQAYLGGGALVAIFVVLKLANESSSMSIGFFLGIVAAGLTAAGGYLLYTEAGGQGFRR